MRLQLCTWPEVEQYLSKSTGIIIPIGATEQHGPSGLIGTDAICAETISFGVGEKISAMVAPTISVGMSQHHMAFTGSITLKPSTLITVIKEWIYSLAQHGFNRFFFINGHGGNRAVLQAAFSEVYQEYGSKNESRQLKCRAVNWWENPETNGLGERLFGAGEGSHATPGEISVASFAYPDYIKPCATSGTASRETVFFDRHDFRSKFPDGRMGSDPSLASISYGEALYNTAVDEIAGLYVRFVNGS